MHLSVQASSLILHLPNAVSDIADKTSDIVADIFILASR